MSSLYTPPLRVASAVPGKYVFRNARGDTLDFHDGRWLIVKRVRGEGLAPATDSTSGGVVQRGVTLRRTLVQPRVLSFECLSVVNSRFYLEELHRQLTLVLDPELGIGRYERRRGDGTLYYLDCKLTSTLDLEMSFDAIHNGEPIPFELTAYDPDFYAEADTVIPILSSGSTKSYPPVAPVFPTAGEALYLGEPATLVYEGSAPTEPVIVVNGPILNPVVANLDTNEVIEVSASVGLGAHLTVDMRRGQKTISITGPVAAPTDAPAGGSVAGSGALAAGAYRLAYTYVSSLGETEASPYTSYTVGASGAIVAPPIVRPFGVASINWYLSTAAGGTILARVVTGSSGSAAIITTAPPPGVSPPIATPAGETELSQLNALVQGFNFWRLTPGDNHLFIGQAPTGLTPDPTNLLPNPSFEVDTAGWVMNAATLARQITNVKYGGAAAVLTPTATGYSVYQQTNALSGATAGRLFLGSIWLYGADQMIGKTLYLLLFETGGALEASWNQEAVLVQRGWQQVSVTHTMNANDRTGLQLRVMDLADTYTSGDSLTLDGARVQEGLVQSGIIADPTNLLPNPTFEVDTASWVPSGGTLSRQTTIAKFGLAAGTFLASAAGYSLYQQSSAMSGATAGRTFLGGYWFYGAGALIGKTLYALLFEIGGAAAAVYSQQAFTVVAGWQWVSVSRVLVDNDRTGLSVYVIDLTNVGASGDTFTIDGARIQEGLEQAAVATINYRKRWSAL